MSTANGQKDPEDMFSDTRMSFGDHLEELRLHLWRAIGGFAVAFIFSFFIGKTVLEYIAQPVEYALGKFYDRRVANIQAELNAKSRDELGATEFVKITFDRNQFKKELGLPVGGAEGGGGDADFEKRPVLKTAEGLAMDTGDPDTRVVEPKDLMTVWVSYNEPLRQQAALQKAQQVVGRRPALSTLSIQEGFVVYLKVCVVCGIVLGSPWIFFQLWMFIAAGLYPHEKKLVHVYLPVSLGLFLLGVAICQIFVMPKAVEALLWFNEWIGLEPDLRLNEWLGFAIWMPVVFGVSFQTPLIMLFLERVGITTVEIYRKQRRICWFVMAVFAALITPSVDPVSMLLLWVPMCLLFELGIWLCLLKPREPDFDIDVPDSEDQVEV